MKKIITTTLFLGIFLSVNAQFNDIDVRLKHLEDKKTFNKNLKNISLDGKRFFLSKNFDDHTERMLITINNNQATYVEVFYDKKNEETSSNVFSGDVKRKDNFVSFYFDKLEGEKVSLPVAKNFILTSENKVIYLIDVNTKERWVDEASIRK